MAEIHDKGRALLGARLAELRNDNGLTLRSLGGMIGMSSGNISRIETGKVNYTIDSALTVTNALGAKIEIVKN